MRKKGLCRLVTACIAALMISASLSGSYGILSVAAGDEPLPGTETLASEMPVVTEAPATEQPVVTEAPATEKPVVTETPATEKPVVTEAPATEKPVVTEAPATEKPVVTEAPATEKPVVTEAPATQKPEEPTASPAGQPTPMAGQETESPGPEGDPTGTPAPSTTDAPDATGEAPVTESPKPTDDPRETDGPDATETPAPSDEPDVTDDPEATETPSPTDGPEEEFVTDGDVLVRYTGSGKVVTIPDGIRVIGPDAFLGNETLEAVILPDSVEEIGERAFGNCSKLKEVILSTDSLLKKIGSRAFLNCVRINRSFAEAIEEVAADAFEGVPEETATPEPAATETPAPEPAVTETPAPQPTEEPWEEPEDPEEPEEPEDPYEDIEWEPMPVPAGGGGGGGKWQPHAKSRLTMTHDYDQVQLDGADQAEAMSILTLGDEQLQIGIAEGLFTVHLEEIRDGETEENHLVLTAVEQTDCRWEINGAGLRKLEKSGIDRLVLRTGTHTVSMPTEDYLAGWKYEELKSRGTAGRRFTFFLEMNASSAKWSVEVQGKETELGTDPLSGMYLTGVTDKTEQDGTDEMGGQE